jgi:sRNA-binding protein
LGLSAGFGPTHKEHVELAKPNFQYEKRQKELAKKKKQEEKRLKKQAAKEAGAEPQAGAEESPAPGETKPAA